MPFRSSFVPAVLLLIACLSTGAPGVAAAQAPAAAPKPAATASPAQPPLATTSVPASSERLEPGLEDRRQRYARPAWQHVAMVPAYVLRAPFQLLGYPLRLLVHKDPGPFTVYTRRSLVSLNKVGVGVRIGGLGSGSGAGIGLRYELPQRFTLGHPLRFLAATTYNGYDFIGASLDSLRWGSGRTSLRVGYAERPREDFFGLGPDTPLSDRATYQLDETRVALESFVPLRGAWHFMFDLAATRNDVGRGRDPDFPTVLEVFDPNQIEGLSGRFEFFDWAAGFNYDTRDVPTYARRGRNYTLQVLGAEGINHTVNAYTKVAFEAQEFLPLPLYHTSLAARLRAVRTDNRGDNGVQVPIFRLERVGGSRTVRGYQTFRYTEHDAFIFDFEYRFPIWDIGLPSQLALDGALFFDFGSAVRNLEDMRQDDLRSSGGFGFRLVNFRGMIGRLENAWTPEGYRYHATLRGTF